MHIDVYAPISKAAKPYGPIARHLSFLHSGRLFRVSSTYLSHTRQPRTLLKRGKRPRHSEAGKLTRPSFICMSSQADQPTSAPICLTIAGSDSGGGAGIQADLKTFSALGVFGTSAITALTSQNTQGVNAIHNAPEEFVTKQICSVLDDMNVSVVKIGMLPNAKVVKAVAECLSKRTQQGLQVVLDPVLISTSGHSLAESDVSQAILQELFPLATIVTPNLAEAGALLGESNVASLKDMKEAAKKLQKVGPNAVLVKGGHLGEIESASRPKGEEELIDVLCVNGDIEMISGPKIATKNTHGTGCTTASAISAFLARRNTIRESVKNARNYVTNALAYSSHLQIGQGPQRPFNHSYEVDDWQNRRKDIDLRLYAVTDPDCNIKRNRSNSESVQLALEGGTTCVQLREKSADGARFCEEAQKVLQACRTHGVRLVINDRVDVALAVGADGVHVGQDDIPAKLARKLIGPGKILGVSVKTVDQAIKAEQDGADYLGSGAMFETATKSSSTISFETLKEICESVKIPVVAIGGIKKEHVKRCLEMGCKGVAFVSAIFASEDACKATQEIRSEIDAYHGR